MSTDPHLDPHDAPVEGTLGEYARALLRRWLLIVAIAAAVVLATVAISLMLTPKYRATTTLQIEREAMKVLDMKDLIPSESPMDRDFYQTQYELLMSRSLARRVIAKTGLADHPAYREEVEALTKKLDGKAAPSRRVLIERALTEQVLASLQIEPVRNSRLVKVHFESPDPALSARVANTYASEFIASGLERRLQASSFATDYLSDRLAQLRQRLEDSEKNFVEFAGQEKIVSVGEDRPSLPAQNLAELNALLATAQDARIKSEAAWRQARYGSGLALPQVVSNPLIQSLMQTRAQLSAEYQQKLSTFKPDYPDMLRLNRQLGEVGQQINFHVANIRESIKAEYDAASAQEQMLENRIEQLKGAELDLQDRSIRYNMLKREVDTNRQLYDGMLQRFKEIGVGGNVGANNISVVDPADVPGRPSSPRWAFNLALAAIFGLFAGVLAALLLHVARVPRRPRP
ncbi:GumC family protein [Pseudoxanthomonas putridarboris]|uniref:GumC family protein n=2 Tax=Pseudoxanthomonas putridarboris TaxID=752605 RepID=A0ABU9IWS7_9GAMM